jgi:hypothetical protein
MSRQDLMREVGRCEGRREGGSSGEGRGSSCE